MTTHISATTSKVAESAFGRVWTALRWQAVSRYDATCWLVRPCVRPMMRHCCAPLAMMPFARVGDDRQQALDPHTSYRRHNPELRHMRPHRVRQLSKLTVEHQPNPVKHHRVLLLRRLHRDVLHASMPTRHRGNFAKNGSTRARLRRRPLPPRLIHQLRELETPASRYPTRSSQSSPSCLSFQLNLQSIPQVDGEPSTSSLADGLLPGADCQMRTLLNHLLRRHR